MKPIQIFSVVAMLFYASALAQSSNSTNSATNSSIIRVGMNFATVDKILKEHGAKIAPLQVSSHIYILKDGSYIQIITDLGKPNRIIKYISIPTYTPKNWESKTDVERTRFFDSFTNIEAYDLEKTP